MNSTAILAARTAVLAFAALPSLAQIQPDDWLVATANDPTNTIAGATGGIWVVPHNGGTPWQLGGLSPDLDGSNDIAALCVGSDLAVYYIVGPNHLPSPRYDTNGMMRQSQRGSVWRCPISGSTATATRLQHPITSMWETPTAIVVSLAHDADSSSVATSRDNDRVWFTTRSPKNVMLNWVHVAGWSHPLLPPACGGTECQGSYPLTVAPDWWIPTAMCTDGRTMWIGMGFQVPTGGAVYRVDARVPQGVAAPGVMLAPLCPLPSTVAQMAVDDNGQLVVGTVDGKAYLVDPLNPTLSPPALSNGGSPRQHAQQSATAFAWNAWTRELGVVPGVAPHLLATGAASPAFEVWNVANPTSVTLTRSVTLPGMIPTSAAVWALPPSEYFGSDCAFAGTSRPKIAVLERAIAPSSGPLISLVDAATVNTAWCRVGFSAASTLEFSQSPNPPIPLPIAGPALGGEAGCWLSTNADVLSSNWVFPSANPTVTPSFRLGPLTASWAGAVLYCQWLTIWQDPLGIYHFGSSDAVRLAIRQ